MNKYLILTAFVILAVIISAGCTTPETKDPVIGEWELSSSGSILGSALETVSELLNSAVSSIGLNGLSLGNIETGNKININEDGSGNVKTSISYTIDALNLNIGIIEIGAEGDFIWNKEDSGYNLKLNKNKTYSIKLLNGESTDPAEFLTNLLGEKGSEIIAKLEELNISGILMAQDNDDGLNLLYSKDDDGKEVLTHNGEVMYTKI